MALLPCSALGVICRKFEDNNSCGFPILGNWKIASQHCLRKMDKPRSPQWRWLLSRNADLNWSNTRRVHLI